MQINRCNSKVYLTSNVEKTTFKFTQHQVMQLVLNYPFFTKKDLFSCLQTNKTLNQIAAYRLLDTDLSSIYEQLLIEFVKIHGADFDKFCFYDKSQRNTFEHLTSYLPNLSTLKSWASSYDFRCMLPNKIKRLDLTNKKGSLPCIGRLNSIAQLHGLTELKLMNFPMRDIELKSLFTSDGQPTLKNLKSLSLENCQIYAGLFPLIAKINTLNKLILKEEDEFDERSLFELFSSLPDLVTFIVNGKSVCELFKTKIRDMLMQEDVLLQILKHLPLKALNRLAYTNRIWLSVFLKEIHRRLFNNEIICKVDEEKALELALNFPILPSASIETNIQPNLLSKFTNLRHLIFNYEIKNTHLLAMSCFTNLLNLTISCNQGADDSGYVALSSLKNLTSLNLSHSSIGNSGLLAVALLTKLCSLDLNYCPIITGESFSALSSLTNLTSLNLSGHSLKDCDLNHLTHLTNLTKLSLINNSIGSGLTPAGLNTLKVFTNLTYLNLNNNDLYYNEVRQFMLDSKINFQQLIFDGSSISILELDKRSLSFGNPY